MFCVFRRRVCENRAGPGCSRMRPGRSHEKSSFPTHGNSVDLPCAHRGTPPASQPHGPRARPASPTQGPTDCPTRRTRGIPITPHQGGQTRPTQGCRTGFTRGIPNGNGNFTPGFTFGITLGSRFFHFFQTLSLLVTRGETQGFHPSIRSSQGFFHDPRRSLRSGQVPSCIPSRSPLTGSNETPWVGCSQ